MGKTGGVYALSEGTTCLGEEDKGMTEKRNKLQKK